jgi:polyisoprenoid-binding protein YceI
MFADLKSIGALLGPIVTALLILPDAHAAAADYAFKDPKTLNSVVLVLDSPLEPMVATATGIRGILRFDPARPQQTTGKIVVDAASVQFSNPGLTATAQGPDGFNTAKYPTIEFALREVKNLRTISPSVHAATIVGDFTCRGVTKRLTVDATASHHPGKASERHRSGSDLLVLRSTFKIRRQDFGIKPRQGDNLLADEIEVRLAIAGAAP